jgi:hypothetical protein
MKTEKLNLKSIKNVLSRAEMKNIMAGSGSSSSSTNNGHCCMHNNDGPWTSDCGHSMQYVKDNFAQMGYSNWCCSSCVSSLGV